MPTRRTSLDLRSGPCPSEAGQVDRSAEISLWPTVIAAFRGMDRPIAALASSAVVPRAEPVRIYIVGASSCLRIAALDGTVRLPRRLIRVAAAKSEWHGRRAASPYLGPRVEHLATPAPIGGVGSSMLRGSASVRVVMPLDDLEAIWVAKTGFA